MIKTCPLCDKDFNSSDIGAGYKYCTPQCRDTKGGTILRANKRGRPRRFPRVTDAERRVILNHLKERGFFLQRGDYKGEHEKTLCFYAQKASSSCRITFGGDIGRERWAWAVLYIENGRIRTESTCERSKAIVKGRIKPYRKTVACHRIYECQRCSAAALFAIGAGLSHASRDPFNQDVRELITNPPNVAELTES